MIPPFTHCIAPGCLVGVALYVTVLAWRGRHAGPHPDGCRCGPCRDFEFAVRDACLVVAAEVVPGPGPRDGKRLDRWERRALRGIEAAIREQVSQP